MPVIPNVSPSDFKGGLVCLLWRNDERCIIKRRLQCFFIYLLRVYLVCHAQLWQFIPKKIIKGQSIPNESATQELFSLLRVIENNDNICCSPQSQWEWISFLLMPKPRRHSSYFNSLCISLKWSALGLI